MITSTEKIEDIIKNPSICPFPLTVIPNYMGINLCSVESISWTRQSDGQLCNLIINFIPKK